MCECELKFGPLAQKIQKAFGESCSIKFVFQMICKQEKKTKKNRGRTPPISAEFIDKYTQ